MFVSNYWYLKVIFLVPENLLWDINSLILVGPRKFTLRYQLFETGWSQKIYFEISVVRDWLVPENLLLRYQLFETGWSQKIYFWDISCLRLVGPRKFTFEISVVWDWLVPENLLWDTCISSLRYKESKQKKAMCPNYIFFDIRGSDISRIDFLLFILLMLLHKLTHLTYTLNMTAISSITQYVSDIW